MSTFYVQSITRSTVPALSRSLPLGTPGLFIDRHSSSCVFRDPACKDTSPLTWLHPCVRFGSNRKLANFLERFCVARDERLVSGHVTSPLTLACPLHSVTESNKLHDMVVATPQLHVDLVKGKDSMRNKQWVLRSRSVENTC